MFSSRLWRPFGLWETKWTLFSGKVPLLCLSKEWLLPKTPLVNCVLQEHFQNSLPRSFSSPFLSHSKSLVTCSLSSHSPSTIQCRATDQEKPKCLCFTCWLVFTGEVLGGSFSEYPEEHTNISGSGVDGFYFVAGVTQLLSWHGGSGDHSFGNRNKYKLGGK